MPLTIPAVDLFAGPGGLSEGFSRYSSYFGDEEIAFRVRLSIEKNPIAAATLRLRAFVRAFEGRDLPEAYYRYVRSHSPSEKATNLARLQSFPEWQAAEQEAWNAALGQVGFVELHSRIKDAVCGSKIWALLGGPPCQAYSVVGRSRRMGLGEVLRNGVNADELEQLAKLRADAFFSDERHFLYREYLKIVAIHQPPIFVMENVKGILSSKASDGSFIFERILADLENPLEALRGEEFPEGAEKLIPEAPVSYTIHSFVECPKNGRYRKQDYLIRCERFGIPQQRHRVILLGIRSDLAIAPPKLQPEEEAVSLEQVIGDLPAIRSGRSGRSKYKIRADVTDSSERWLEAVRSSVSDQMLRDVQDADSAVAERIVKSLSELRAGIGRGAGFVAGDFQVRAAETLRRWYSDDRLGGVLNHEARDHMDADFARYLFVACYGQVHLESPKLRHFPETFLPAHRNAATEEGRRVFHDRFRVQLPNSPATTITSHIRKDGHYFIHYDPRQCRSLTVREAARVQTFPDNYFFEGSRTEQYEQVGNAVPPLLAVKLARVVANVLRQMAPNVPAVGEMAEAG